MMDDVDEHAVDGYEIVIPPGWEQYPVRPGIAEKLYEHVRKVVEPSGNTAMLSQLRTAIRRSMADLRRNGGIDLFLPRRRDDELLIPAALTSVRVALGSAGVHGAVARLSAGHDPEEVDVPVGVAYRWEDSSDGSGALAGVQGTNVHYVFPLPGDAPESAVVFTFGIIEVSGMSEEYREILVLMFDAMMQSLGWVRSS